MIDGIWSFAGMELLALVLPAFVCFKSREHFVLCLRSFLKTGSAMTAGHASQLQDKQSIRFAIYFSIVFLISSLNIELVL